MPKIRQAKINTRKRARKAIRGARVGVLVADAKKTKTVAGLRAIVIELAKIVEHLVVQEQTNEKH